MRTLKALMNLGGRVAVITGGTGHLGKVMAETLAELGCSILLVDRSDDTLKSTCEQISSSWGVKTKGIKIDLGKENERCKLPHILLEQFKRADILINNAAFVGDSSLSGWSVPFEEQQIDTWRKALEVNLTASFHLSQILAPMLKSSGHGVIVNIGSIYGTVGPDLTLYDGTNMNNPAAYAASKGGLIQMTRWLSSVLAPTIRVNCISPGGIARGQPAAFTKRYIERTPLHRMGKEEDFKGAVAFLASDLSNWVTGENLMVDGGWTVW